MYLLLIGLSAAGPIADSSAHVAGDGQQYRRRLGTLARCAWITSETGESDAFGNWDPDGTWESHFNATTISKYVNSNCDNVAPGVPAHSLWVRGNHDVYYDWEEGGKSTHCNYIPASTGSDSTEITDSWGWVVWSGVPCGGWTRDPDDGSGGQWQTQLNYTDWYIDYNGRRYSGFSEQLIPPNVYPIGDDEGWSFSDHTYYFEDFVAACQLIPCHTQPVTGPVAPPLMRLVSNPSAELDPDYMVYIPPLGDPDEDQT